MNLSQLYYFRKLSELQHYTRAAKELYITQPALSDAIRSLEKELGVPLFQKEGRNVKLTRYGREFSVYVHDALRELDKGIAVMHEYTGKLSGNLSIGGLYTITGDYLPSLIRAYHDNYGEAVKMEVSQGFSLDLIQGLKEDRYDIVFAARKDDEPTLCFEPIVAHQLVVGVRKGCPIAQLPCVSLEDLHGYEIHTYRSGTPIGNEVERVLTAHGIAAHQDFDDEITMGGHARHGPSRRVRASDLYDRAEAVSRQNRYRRDRRTRGAARFPSCLHGVQERRVPEPRAGELHRFRVEISRPRRCASALQRRSVARPGAIPRRGRTRRRPGNRAFFVSCVVVIA